ncbi:hypothetical protein [Frigidibacter sp. SD6-1]|uniref:hypothetical protein n=1 Tax=Frigidibacter sp. SD6-1 TaxID=3032581 RepID=UPI0024DF95BB|nr:hypothetical protein [Frigidibacter sp. SD6-1]
MFTKKARSALIAALLLSTGPAFAETMVKEVQVDIDMDAVQNLKAANQWANIADDLENAVVGRLAGRTADDGAKISIDIDEVTLANTIEQMAGVADSKLTGHVNVTHDNNNTVFDSYDLTVTFDQAGPLIVSGTDLAQLTTNSKEYYDAMIAAFADRVVADLK